MAKTKYEWIPIEEMDLEDGTHTGYYIRDPKDPKQDILLTQMADNTWDVEVFTKHYGGRLLTVANCKTLTSAKRWVARYW